MLDLIIKLLNIAGTVGVFALLWQMQKNPELTPGSVIGVLISTMLFIAIPLAIAIITVAASGKWPVVYFICAMTNICAVAVWAGYRYGRRYHKDAFETAMFGGIAALMIFGGPVGAYFLP